MRYLLATLLTACVAQPTQPTTPAPQNRPPTAPVITLSPAAPLEGEAITATLSATDPEGDALTYAVVWERDGVIVTGLAEVIPAATTHAGEVWSVTGTASDEAHAGPASEVSVSIGAAALLLPNAVSVSIAPTVVAEGGGALICTLSAAPRDAQGAAAVVSVSWSVDGFVVPADKGLATTVYPNDTVPAGAYVGGQTWTCDVIVTRGAAPEELEAEVTVTSPFPLATVRLPPGTYLMGVPEGEYGYARVNHSPIRQVQVTLTRPFAIGTYEVDWDLFESISGGTAAPAPCRRCPRGGVTWLQAAYFLDRLSVNAGLSACYSCSGDRQDPTCAAGFDPYPCTGFRFPTAGEWEYAARNGGRTAGAFPTGADAAMEFGPDPDFWGDVWCGDVPLTDGSWLSDQANICTAELQAVGRGTPSLIGLFDMSGNVSEFTHDYGFYDDLSVDPFGTTGDHVVRSWIKGGNSFRESNYTRVGELQPESHNTPRSQNGLRVARTLPSSAIIPHPLLGFAP